MPEPLAPRTGLQVSGGRAVKSLEAANVTLLKQVLQIELDALRADAGVDLVFLMGVDGRIFASSIPRKLAQNQYRLMERVKQQVPLLAAALRQTRLKLQVQTYEEGAVLIMEVGDGAFLAAVKVDHGSMKGMDPVIRRADVACKAIAHILKEKGFSDEEMRGYAEEVRSELKTLSYRLFREAYDTTKGARKNREIAEFLRRKIKDRLGAGLVDEVMDLTYNELGTTERFMNDKLWQRFVELVVEKHVRRLTGDIVADVCRRTWSKDVGRMIESFV
jgi:hypothetical protein